jgi:hypothetical protein
VRSCEYRLTASTRNGPRVRTDVCGGDMSFPPPLCRSPKQGAAPQRGDDATAPGVAGRPRAASRAPQPTRRGAQAASRVMAMHDRWRREVGRQARQSGGGFVRSRQNISTTSNDQRVQLRCAPFVPRNGAAFDWFSFNRNAFRMSEYFYMGLLI